jgi:hypothetical protein
MSSCASRPWPAATSSFGLWAAGQLGQSGAEADAYAKTVVAADFEEAGDDDVLRKVRKDLEAGGKTVSDAICAAPWTSSSPRPWKR